MVLNDRWDSTTCVEKRSSSGSELLVQQQEVEKMSLYTNISRDSRSIISSTTLRGICIHFHEACVRAYQGMVFSENAPIQLRSHIACPPAHSQPMGPVPPSHPASKALVSGVASKSRNIKSFLYKSASRKACI